VRVVSLRLTYVQCVARNRALEPARRIPDALIVSKSECLRLAPGIREQGLTGGAFWYDALMLNSERLLFAILHAAIDAGAEAANYAEATEVLVRSGRVEGIRVRDASAEKPFDIRARAVVNAAGPWSVGGLGIHSFPAQGDTVRLARAMNLVTRPILGERAIGVARCFHDESGALRSDRRLFF